MATKKKAKLPPLSKFDWKKELRGNGYKISRTGKITKEVLNQPKGGESTEKQLLRRQAKYNIPAYKTKGFTKQQALNNLARNIGYKDINSYFKARKTGKHRVFERYAREAKKKIGLGSKFEKQYKKYADSGFDHGQEEYDLLSMLDMVDEDDYDPYSED